MIINVRPFMFWESCLLSDIGFTNLNFRDFFNTPCYLRVLIYSVLDKENFGELLFQNNR